MCVYGSLSYIHIDMNIYTYRKAVPEFGSFCSEGKDVPDVCGRCEKKKDIHVICLWFIRNSVIQYKNVYVTCLWLIPQ